MLHATYLPLKKVICVFIYFLWKVFKVTSWGLVGLSILPSILLIPFKLPALCTNAILKSSLK